jgi:hypothetical protein
MFSINRQEDDTRDGSFDPDQFIDYNELDSDTMFKTTLLTPDPDSKSPVSNRVQFLPNTNTSINKSLELESKFDRNVTGSHSDLMGINLSNQS